MLFLGSSSVRPAKGDNEAAPENKSPSKSGIESDRIGLLLTSIKTIALLSAVAVTAIVFTKLSTLNTELQTSEAGEQFMLSQRCFSTSIDALILCLKDSVVYVS